MQLLKRMERGAGTSPLVRRHPSVGGERQTIAGHARDRYVYAPAAGLFRTALQIGDIVSAGQEVARIDDAVSARPSTENSRPDSRRCSGCAEDQGYRSGSARPQALISGIAERPRRIAGRPGGHSRVANEAVSGSCRLPALPGNRYSLEKLYSRL